MKTNRLNLSFLLFVLLFYNCKSTPDFKLQEGDVLFQDVDCGPFCDAIEAVTQGVNNYNFSHVGLVMINKNNDIEVMETISSGVVLTPLEDFLNRSSDANHDPKVIVGRLKPKFQNLIPAAITFINSKMDASYDDFFNLDNDKYYCSELIYLAYKSANNNDPIFKEQPMTFIAPDTNETFAIWQTYFNNLNYPVPEGQPGINPGGMSQSPFIDIVHFYGNPSKSKR